MGTDIGSQIRVEDLNISREMFRMMRAVPRMASLRQATIQSQTVKSVNHKASISLGVMSSVMTRRFESRT